MPIVNSDQQQCQFNSLKCYPHNGDKLMSIATGREPFSTEFRCDSNIFKKHANLVLDDNKENFCSNISTSRDNKKMMGHTNLPKSKDIRYCESSSKTPIYPNLSKVLQNTSMELPFELSRASLPTKKPQWKYTNSFTC